MKYLQSQIAFQPLYDRVPGTARNKLFGFFRDRNDRLLTGRAKVNENPEPVVHAMPLGYDAKKSFLLTRSVAPLKRDKRSRPIGRKR